MKHSILGGLTFVLIFLAVMALSFFVNAGILWLICRLLNMSWWSWRVATAIWLIEFLLSGVFNANTKQ